MLVVFLGMLASKYLFHVLRLPLGFPMLGMRSDQMDVSGTFYVSLGADVLPTIRHCSCT